MRISYIDSNGTMYYDFELVHSAFLITNFSISDYQDIIDYYVGYKPWGLYMHLET